MSTEELIRVRSILTCMLDSDFPEAQIFRSQLELASLHRHGTGCGIAIDRARAAPATFDPAHPSLKLAVEAFGHGKLWIMLHAHEGYLDDLELVDAAAFPSPETLKIRTDA